MTLPKRKFRQILFQVLFSLDFQEKSDPSSVDLVSYEFKVPKKTAYQLIDTAKEIKEKFFQIDPLIEKASTSYAFNRISKTELNILRLALYEMLFSDVPPKVVMAEAIRLTRKFGTRDSADFINALLDDIYKNTILSPK